MLKRLSIVAFAAVAAATPGFAFYSIDDGTAEDSVGVGAGPNSFLWGNNYTIEAGCETIMNVICSFGTAAFPDPTLNGRAVTAFVARANADGTLMQGGLLASLNGVIAGQGTDSYIVFDTADVTLNVGDKFMIGMVHNMVAGEGAKYPAGFDTTDPDLPGRSYAAFTGGTGSVPIDPNNINAVAAGSRGFIEAFGLPGNWTLRAECTAVPEPATFVVLGAALLGLGVARRRK